MTLVHKFIGHIAVFLELGHQHLTTLVDRQFLVLVFKELTNLVARLAGLDHVEPVTARSKGVGVGDNFNLIPCLELGCQWNHATIDLGTRRFFTDLGMDFIGKVNRSWIFWKGTDSTIWGKDVNLLCQIVFLNWINKFLGIISLVLELHHLLDPVHPNSWFLAVNLPLNAFLISPVSRNPVLSNLVHGFSSNLKLNRSFWPIDSRMDRLVTISLAISDIVFETTRHGFPKLMHITQHGINITLGIQNATNGNQVIDFLKPFSLVLHFAENRVNMLGTTVNLPI